MTRLVPKDNPGPIFKRLFKTPIFFYRIGLIFILMGLVKIAVSIIGYLNPNIRMIEEQFPADKKSVTNHKTLLNQGFKRSQANDIFFDRKELLREKGKILITVSNTGELHLPQGVQCCWQQLCYCLIS
jgi:hypothetical protein